LPPPTSTYAISRPRIRRRCFLYGNAAEIIFALLPRSSVVIRIGSHRSWRQIAEERTQTFGDREVRDNSVTQLRVREFGEHSSLNRSHGLAGLGADHGEPKDV